MCQLVWVFRVLGIYNFDGCHAVSINTYPFFWPRAMLCSRAVRQIALFFFVCSFSTNEMSGRIQIHWPNCNVRPQDQKLNKTDIRRPILKQKKIFISIHFIKIWILKRQMLLIKFDIARWVFFSNFSTKFVSQALLRVFKIRNFAFHHCVDLLPLQ